MASANRGVTQPSIPVVYGQLRGQDRGSAGGASAVVDDLQQVGTGGWLQQWQCPVVEHQHLDARQHGQSGGEGEGAIGAVRPGGHCAGHRAGVTERGHAQAGSCAGLCAAHGREGVGRGGQPPGP